MRVLSPLPLPSMTKLAMLTSVCCLLHRASPKLKGWLHLYLRICGFVFKRFIISDSFEIANVENNCLFKQEDLNLYIMHLNHCPL